jgi:hypothetical protein
MWDFRSIWREMARNPSFLSLPQCGHLPHEERPQQVNAALLHFLEDTSERWQYIIRPCCHEYDHLLCSTFSGSRNGPGDTFPDKHLFPNYQTPHGAGTRSNDCLSKTFKNTRVCQMISGTSCRQITYRNARPAGLEPATDGLEIRRLFFISRC